MKIHLLIPTDKDTMKGKRKTLETNCFGTRWDLIVCTSTDYHIWQAATYRN